MINSLVNTAKEEDITNIVKLYSNEGNIFISELKNLVRPVITGLIETFNVDKEAKQKVTGTNYNIKLLDNVELFDYLQDNNLLRVIGNGAIPPNLNLGFPINHNDVSNNQDYIRSRFITSNSEINSITQSFLESKSNEELLLFWNKYMLNIGFENSAMHTLFTLNYRKLDDLVLLTLALTKILEGDVDYVSSIDVLNANKINISDFLNTFILKYMDTIEKSKHQLLIDYVEENSKVEIFLASEQYQDFLDNGGDIDSIVGYTIKSKKENLPKSVIKDVILADTNLKNYYSEKVNLEKVVNHTYNINAISKQWEAYAVKILNDFTNIKGKVICFTNDKNLEITNYLKSLKNDEVLDTNKVILNIVSMLDKDVGDFIENMNSLLKTDNKDTESVAKEAALYASIIRLVNRMLIDVECIRKQ
jgi:hypothetical protein